ISSGRRTSPTCSLFQLRIGSVLIGSSARRSPDKGRTDDLENGVAGPRDCPLDVEKVLLGIDAHDDQVLGCCLAATEAARGSGAGVDAGRKSGRSDRAGQPMKHGTVRRDSSPEVMAADDARKALPLRKPDDVDVVLLPASRA